jgi:uncharacterized protein YbjT (DUF2867 family)
VLEAICREGHIITCLVRKSSKKKLLTQPAAQKLFVENNLSVIEAEWTEPDSWLRHVAGHDVVINTIGIIREKRPGDFDAVHTDAPIALFRQAAASNVGKIIQISAMGADDKATSRFHLSKRKADTYLSKQEVPHAIFRPSFVYGKGESSMTLFSKMAALPVTPVAGDGQYKVQPIYIDDLVKAIRISIERDDLRSICVDAGGGSICSFDQMLQLLGQKQGKSVRLLHVPWEIMHKIARTSDFFGGYGPITTEELSMLRRGNYSKDEKFADLFGFKPLTFAEGITLS